MKKSKWTKWQVGLLGTLGLAALFHEVKGSAAFATAVENAKSGTTAAQTADTEVQQPKTDSALGLQENPGGRKQRRHRGEAFGSGGGTGGGSGSFGEAPNSSGSGSFGSSSDSGSGSSGITSPQTTTPHTRTTRS